MNLFKKIGLGTAQWGMPYGISNRSGQPDYFEIGKMLDHAKSQGITILDTAYTYGEAEIILGEQGAILNGFDVVTKTIPISSRVISKKEIEQLSTAFFESLDRLKSDTVYGLLVHNADNLLSRGGDHFWKTLQVFKNEKRVKKIGVSVYRPRQLEEIINRYEIDVVQIPFNIYDQRFAREGIFQKLKHKGIEIHSRSVFLQGLLLMKPDQLPAQFELIRDHQAKLHKQLSDSGLTLIEGCLIFCLNQPYIDKIFIGCETLGQLSEVLSNSAHSCHPFLDLEPYAIDDQKVIDPSRWHKLPKK